MVPVSPIRSIDPIGGRVAYQVVGVGPPDVVHVPSLINHIEALWDLPELAARSLSPQIRTGIHTGEVEHRGSDIAGIAVHIAARISALARAGETLVSATVRDLLVGSDLAFSDRGPHPLKGVPGSWHLYAIVRPGSA